MPLKHRQYQIKVVLKGTKPPVWRRLLVSSATKLPELHSILKHPGYQAYLTESRDLLEHEPKIMSLSPQWSKVAGQAQEVQPGRHGDLVDLTEEKR